jgi:hypothetical protein
MDVFTLKDDGSKQLLAAGLDAGEIVELQEQWRYTKPFGSGIKFLVREQCQTIVSFSTTGTEPGWAAERHSEIFVG